MVSRSNWWLGLSQLPRAKKVLPFTCSWMDSSATGFGEVADPVDLCLYFTKASSRLEPAKVRRVPKPQESVSR